MQNVHISDNQTLRILAAGSVQVVVVDAEVAEVVQVCRGCPNSHRMNAGLWNGARMYAKQKHKLFHNSTIRPVFQQMAAR